MLKGAEMSKRCGGVPHNRHTVLEAGTGLLYERFILLYKLRLLEAPLCQRVYLFKFILTFSFVFVCTIYSSIVHFLYLKTASGLFSS